MSHALWLDDPDYEPRRWARRTVLGAIATGAVLLLAFTGHEPTDNGRTATPVAHLEEDQPGWDCATMGNHICGPCR